jgi:hypothetical protein
MEERRRLREEDGMQKIFTTGQWVMAVALCLMTAGPLHARINMVALPDRGKTLIRLDNPLATLIEEERILTLQKGVNSVDFSWEGVRIDTDSIRLAVVSHRDQVRLLNVSYPPAEQALVWELHADAAAEVRVRIAYLLAGIDRLTAYKGVADKKERRLHLKEFFVLRNFSGEDFAAADLLMGDAEALSQRIQHEETRQRILSDRTAVPITKVWTFDARTLPWDPEQQDTNVGIPVRYHIPNTAAAGLGARALPAGKVRLFQDDGHGGTIFLGEDRSPVVPRGEMMKVRLGDSRDIVVTQRKMQERRINVRRNKKNRVILYDTDEILEAKLENFKDEPARLTVLEEIPGQWDMADCSHEYTRRSASIVEFEIELPARGREKLVMHYHRRNVR